MINKEQIDSYCSLNSLCESQDLKKIREYTFKHEDIPAMISGPLVVNFLKSLIKIKNVKKILEIGMFTGYSALGMAEELEDDGEIHTCELMLTHTKTAQNFFNKTKHKNKIHIQHGKALDIIQNYSINTFDMIFIDADKINYINYYKQAMRLIKNHGMIVLDNMLWGGEVLNPKTDEASTLNELNQIISQDTRNFNLLLPIRDGLMLCIKNE